MPKPEQAPEPSIEEILASIRRIIADDAPAAAVNEAALDAESATPAPPAKRGKLADHPSGPRLVEDEVLELTEDFMLAEEASAAMLAESAEPGDFVVAGDYETRGEASSYSDPYDESFGRRAARAVGTAPMPEPEPEFAREPGPAPRDSTAESDALFSAVMAEVQRFDDDAPKSEPAAASPSPSDNWGQPDFAALAPQPSARPASRPVWSARHKEPDSGQSSAEPATARPAAADAGSDRQGGTPFKDDWSLGMQTPAPDSGPGMPFPAEQAGEPRAQDTAPPAQQPTAQSVAQPPLAEALPVVPSTEDERPAEAAPKEPSHLVAQEKAEELADKAVSDFASDRLSAPPLVADILKADKPLMDAISSSLANALSSRGGQEPDEFEDAPHPEDFAPDIFEGDKPAGTETAQSPLDAAGRQSVPGLPNLDIGFLSQRPVAAEIADSSSAADQEMPELPREDIDDILSATEPSGLDRDTSDLAAYRTSDIPEPLMQNAPAAPSRVSPRTVAGLGTVREPVPGERLQPVTGASALEETIKEMLKPLLLQWLDENMPRIVNEALREEIAANGLLPKAREARR